jgi:hypothetical protein
LTAASPPAMIPARHASARSPADSKANGAVAARGVAQTAMLVCEGYSPLYSPQISDVALNRRLADVAPAL